VPAVVLTEVRETTFLELALFLPQGDIVVGHTLTMEGIDWPWVAAVVTLCWLAVGALESQALEMAAQAVPLWLVSVLNLPDLMLTVL